MLCLIEAGPVTAEFEGLEQRSEVHVEVVVRQESNGIFVRLQLPRSPLNRNRVYMYAVDVVTWRATSHSKQFALPVLIEDCNLSAKVVQDRLNNPFARLPWGAPLSGVLELPHELRRDTQTVSHDSMYTKPKGVPCQGQGDPSDRPEQRRSLCTPADRLMGCHGIGRVHPCKRRRIELKSLVTEIRLSPWAKPEETEEVKHWVKNKNFSCPVNPSDITTRLRRHLTTFENTALKPDNMKPPEQCDHIPDGLTAPQAHLF